MNLNVYLDDKIVKLTHSNEVETYVDPIVMAHTVELLGDPRIGPCYFDGAPVEITLRLHAKIKIAKEDEVSKLLVKALELLNAAKKDSS